MPTKKDSKEIAVRDAEPLAYNETNLEGQSPDASMIIRSAADIMAKAQEKGQRFEVIASLNPGQGFEGKFIGYEPYDYVDKETGEVMELFRFLTEVQTETGPLLVKHSLTVQVLQQIRSAQPGDHISVVFVGVKQLKTNPPRMIKEFHIGLPARETGSNIRTTPPGRMPLPRREPLATTDVTTEG